MKLAVLMAVMLALSAFGAPDPAYGSNAEITVTPQFEQSTITLPPEVGAISSMTFGPDGRLYVGTYSFSGPSGIFAITLDESGREATAIEEIASDLLFVLGLAFDPLAPPNAPVLYASHQRNRTDRFAGLISSFSGPDWRETGVISGLPSNFSGFHLTNGLAFDMMGRLLIAQGSQNEAGTIGVATPLAGAILVADVHDPSFHGEVTYDPPEPSNEMNQASGDVHVYAPGFRNPYDVMLHSNGHIYATDNAAGGGTASSSCSETAGEARANDELNHIEEGSYYGHPNRNRGRFNPEECVYRSPEEPSSGNYRAPIAVFPWGSSCNGMAEYHSDAFGGEMRGDILCIGLSNGELRRAVLSPDGTTVERVDIIDSPSALDFAVRSDGTIYLGITVLSPSSPAVNGDADCGGSVNAIDAALILQYAARLLADQPCPINADADRDGVVDAIDAAVVLQYVADLLDDLPR